MITQQTTGRLDHLTFKGNLKHTRYGWLRLTPAYSVHLVSDLLDAHTAADAAILDPFCGTGTTALVCAERGIACDTTDINPFLVWLTKAKTRFARPQEVDAFHVSARRVATAMRATNGGPSWMPPLHQIEKWWGVPTLLALGRAIWEIKHVAECIPEAAADLLKVALLVTRSSMMYSSL